MLLFHVPSGNPSKYREGGRKCSGGLLDERRKGNRGVGRQRFQMQKGSKVSGRRGGKVNKSFKN